MVKACEERVFLSEEDLRDGYIARPLDAGFLPRRK
jgi:hypothetical protein